MTSASADRTYLGLVRLAVAEPSGVDAATAALLLGAGAGDWLGAEPDRGPDGRRRFATDLRLRISDRLALTSFRKAAYVDLGTPRAIGDGCQVAIEWRASTLAPLFPVFAGTLTLAAGEARIEGFYAPPGGQMGRAVDRALLQMAARWTARWLLAELRRAAAASAPPGSVG